MRIKKVTISFLSCLALATAACTVNQTEEVSESETSHTQTSSTENRVDSNQVAELQNQEGFENEPRYGTVINIGYPGAPCHTAPIIAKELGFFEELGIEVEINLPANENAVNDTVGTGKNDVISNHIASTVIPIVNGLNTTIVSGTQTGCKSLYVMEESEFNSTNDLVGETIAIPGGVGASDHNIALRFLKADGVNPDDVNFTATMVDTAILAMESGEIQAAILPDQFAEPFINEGKIKSIRSLTFDDDFSKEPCCIYQMNTDFMNENPEHAKRISSAIIKARHWIENNTEEATKILYDNNTLSGDFETTLKMMNSYDWTVGQERTEETLKIVIEDYKELGLIDGNIDTEDLMNQLWNPLGINDEFINENIVNDL